MTFQRTWCKQSSRPERRTDNGIDCIFWDLPPFPFVSRFNDEMIRAIVAKAQMSDPEAEAYLTGVILKRRDKVVNYWITRTNPLDRFEVKSACDGLELSFDNAAIRVTTTR